MAKREDSSGYCYHWIRANTSLGNKELWYEDAFQTLIKILTSGELKSGQSLNITYGHPCICFTETPINFIHTDRSKYQPFGLEFYKNDIYTLGGKQIINCTQEESHSLPDNLKWRYARHEPLLRDNDHPHGIDFTWEREIRVNSSVIDFYGESSIIGPTYRGNVDFAFNRILVPNHFFLKKLLYNLSEYYKKEFNENSLKKPEDAPLYDEFFYCWIEEYERRIQSLNIL
ncbi:hypothetical protein [Pectobacterium aroidearum]|uniref:hypothetical protein n=1 Tax=Pectobacterium aroidearum TaxID=1201031 RepID=UPI0032F0293D